jgi:anaerobic magnesium-protoporphyrin IX monomethyl ester cyclase
MKVVLISMPDVAAVIMHESAFHMPNLGIASIGANIEAGHDVYLIDLIRKRRSVRKYLTRTLLKIRPQLVGLSSMTWQFATCLKLVRLIKTLLPQTKIAIGGYHATLMYKEISESAESEGIDFIVRGEGEVTFRRLVEALEGRDRIEEIASLSFRTDNGFVHNTQGELLDLTQIKPPIRDKRRLTWGYHVMNRSVEVMETSRGCTRSCNFCSIRHMYGRSFRPYPMERILADIDTIYYTNKCRWIFISDDNFVLAPQRVIELCRSIIARRYRGLYFIVQADCATMAKNEEMVRLMAEAGFKSIFLGIENVSKKNLKTAHKGDIVDASREAIRICHKYNIMVVGGMIFGFPDDGEQEIIDNYKFLVAADADTSYCQILTPYPKTGIRQQLLDAGLVTNPFNYSRYNGMWANVRTHQLDSDTLQYLVWYHRQTVMGWWKPSERIRRQGRLWTGIWICFFRPFLKIVLGRSLRKYGWRGRFERDMARSRASNQFADL